MKHLFYLLITFWFIPLAAQQSQTARHMENLGFVNIAEADSTIAIDLMYTRADNFTGRVLYEDLHEAYPRRPERTATGTAGIKEAASPLPPDCLRRRPPHERTTKDVERGERHFQIYLRLQPGTWRRTA